MTLATVESAYCHQGTDTKSMSHNTKITKAHKKLIVALDMPTASEANSLLNRLGSSVNFYKIGLELLFGGGLELATELKSKGCEIFLDMKLLDIPNTVEKAVANVARLNLDWLTIHGVDRKTLDAAKRGKGSSDLKLLSVTVMTSVDQADLETQGIAAMTPSKLAVQRAMMACEAGFDGVIASGQDAKAIREATSRLNSNFIIKTPGIRLEGSPVQDQSRTMTPADALAAGADYLVVGRPITDAANPQEAAENFKSQMQQAEKK